MRKQRGPSRRVLVFGDDSRSFLSVVRSLGRQGISVDVCPFEWGTPALQSRYIDQKLRLPPFTLGAAQWNDALTTLLANRHYDLLIPCDERSIIPLLQFEMPAGVEAVVALPSPAAFDVFFDKLLTRRAAADAGVPIAAGRALTDADRAEALAATYGLPLLLKPSRSFALDNPNTRAVVQVCATVTQLNAALAGLRSRSQAFVEQYFSGEGVGVSVLASEGRVLQAFEHRRLHESGVAGGSSYRESAALSADLQGYVRRLAVATRWTGVAMFEFRRDPKSGEAVLLEVNGRFWGSLPLAVASGIDFPFLLYRLLVDGVEEPARAYRLGHRARSVTSDYYAMLRRYEAAREDGRIAGASSVARSALGWISAVVAGETQDSVASDDMAPGFSEYRQLGTTLVRAVTNRMPGLQAMRRRHALDAVTRCATRSGKRDLVIVCQGNICRSPFAEHVLRKALPAGTPVRVRSAGMIALQGRPADQFAIDCAAEYSIDLSDHRSQFASDAMLLEAALIVVFDARNRLALEQRGLALSAPVISLGELCDPIQAQIADPYGHSIDFFRRTFEQIERGIEALLQRFAEAQAR